MESFIAVVPIFLLVGIGFVLRATGIVRPSWIKVLNGFVYYVSLPALVISQFARTEWSADIVRFVAANIIVLIAGALVAAVVARGLVHAQKDRAVVFMGGLIMNSIYLGIPLVERLSSAPHEQIVLAAVIQLVGGMLLSLIGVEYLFVGSRRARTIARKLVYNPLTIGTAAGIALAVCTLASTPFAKSLLTPVDMLAGTASPVALFVLGAFLYGKSLYHKKRVIGLIALIKLVVSPLVAVVIARAILPDASDTAIVVVLFAMPVAVTAFVLSETYKLDTQTVAAAMLVTTLLGMVTLPLWWQILT